ncbi:response regulator [candidate division KSB3 bacterium]|uniref:histidine kinase n=1 Tax=candidate division KSB3 bacterium TaxID=2044937 RepID=A0A9D5JUR5_9BACT|nr:response regulator [candidate division KSB3 bacterium]MBD3324490.1 response regulator [candidate division KSB3 bacterium]
MKSHILLIDDSEASQTAISSVLSEQDEYILTTVASAKEGLAYAEQEDFDLILLDYSLPDMNGIQLLQMLHKKSPDLPIIMVTGSGSERIAVRALKTGASDYMVKSKDFISKLPHVVQDNLDKYAMRRKNRELESRLRESYKKLKELNKELESKVQARTEELERAYQLSNELMGKAVESNMQLAELYSEVDEARRKLDAKIQELSLLNEVGKTMASTLDRDKLIQVTVDSASQELGVEHCAILLYDEEQQRLSIGASRGTPDDHLLAARSVNGHQELIKVMQEHTPLLIPDIESVDRFRPLIEDYPGLECLILVPLYVKNFEIGILTIYGYEYNPTLTEANLEFVCSLASQASVALAHIVLTNLRIQEEQISMIGKMTNYVMHDLKHALQSIRQAVDHLVTEETLTPSQRQETSQFIMEEIDRILGMTQELLEFSYGQRGTLKLQTRATPKFIEDVLAKIERRFTEQHITIQQDLQYTGNLNIDSEKMTRAFLSIAENARDAMPEGGTFTITSRLVNDMICFEFTDTGRGMSPDVQSRIFEPFVSGKSEQGTGLGMTIVKKILEEHNARIDIRSVVSKGTTVRILLPRRIQPSVQSMVSRTKIKTTRVKMGSL